MKDNTMYRSDVVSKEVLDKYNNIENKKTVMKIINEKLTQMVDERLTQDRRSTVNSE